MNKLPLTIFRSPIHFDTPASLDMALCAYSGRTVRVNKSASTPFVLSALRSKVYRSMSGVALTALKLFLLTAALALSNSALAAKNILVFGDSLSAGYGIARDDSWVNLLQQELKKSHPQFEVVNASISGETTAGALRRISRAMQQYTPAVVIIELGANDGLRGATITETEKNLSAIIAQSRKANAKVLLLGMQMPPNYGQDYTRQFRTIFPKLARIHNVILVPYMLEGIQPEQFQADNLHPLASGQLRIMQNILPSLLPLLR